MKNVGENRTEYPLIQQENGTFIVPEEIIKTQNKRNIPIYVVNKDDVWVSDNDRNFKDNPVRNKINKEDISADLMKIILHNDKTGATDNFTRQDYILEASNALLTHNRGVASLPTGSGKTLIIAVLIEQMQNERVLIVAPSLVILQQIKGLLKKLGVDKNVEVLTHLTASKIEPDAIGSVPKYDCIIFDECHKFKCTSYLKSLFRSETKRVYGLSASVNKYHACTSQFHIGEVVYYLPYELARTFKSSINGIKYFHKFEFGKQETEGMKELKYELEYLECEMTRRLHSITERGWAGEMQKRQIIAMYSSMAFLLAEKSNERNAFISVILQEISKKELLNITFLRTKECGRLLIKMMPPKSTLFWCAEGMYIYEKTGDVKLKKVDYEYVDNNFGKELNNILATSCLQMGVNLQFTHGTVNSIMLLSGSTHSSLAQQVGRAVRCNPSPLPARAHTIIDTLPLLNINAENRVKDLSRYFSLENGKEIFHNEQNFIEEYRCL